MPVDLALPADQRVPSWAVTADQLAAWGFPVERRGHCVGVQHILVEGQTFGQARHAAWAAGFVEQASLPDEVRAQQAADRAAAQVERDAHRAEALAWARANLA